MDGYPQIIAMSKMKSAIFLICFISALFFLIFWGTYYTKMNLASLFSGIITAWVTINPLEVKVSAPSEVEIDKVFKVEAEIINKGEDKIENAKGEIFFPLEPSELVLVLLKKEPVQKIGVIPGKKEKTISWSVKGEEIGNYFILVKVSGELQGKELSKESNTITVEIIEKAVPGRKARFNLFQKFFEFFQGWFR